jgi:hypothetical protein
MLGIPTGADPFRHLPHHDIPLHPSSKRPADTDLPLLDSGSKRRRRRPAINAIIVDDEEVWDDEDSESAEDGEIVEVFPNGDGGVQRIDRYASVSEDEFEDEHTDIAALEEDEDESRYALWKQDEREEEDLNGSSSDSGSVITIEPPGPKANGKTAARARREFWAAKGRREVEADDIAGGADDIGVE